MPSEFKKLKAYFHEAVTKWPTRGRSLTLLMDSVDQLDDSHAGRLLSWLPVTGLPSHVRLVLSTLPDYPGDFVCHSVLTRMLGPGAAAQMVEVGLFRSRKQCSCTCSSTRAAR